MHFSSIIQTDQIIGRNIYVYIHVCNNNKKETINLKERREKFWEGLEEK